MKRMLLMSESQRRTYTLIQPVVDCGGLFKEVGV
jgi:hypothetical protein